MVVDTSALLAIFFDEEERDFFKSKIATSARNYIPTASILEAYSRVLGERGEEGARALLLFVEELALEQVAFDSFQLAFAQAGYARYGKGRHPAKLNFGDCISYGLAMALEEPLLFKGNDFVLTDVLQA